MKWIRFKIKTITDAEDIIISSLYDIGLEGAQIENKIPLTAVEKEQMFVDILPEDQDDDGISYLSFFVEKTEEGYAELAGEIVEVFELVEKIQEVLDEVKMFMNIGESSITISETADLDWINNWKQYFHQFYIDDILVVPSWEEVKSEDEERIILHIDPGTAFGTGMHETTQLCVRQLRKYVAVGTRILDVGCGSGILSILALLFGAEKAVGIDLDPCAEEAVEENRKANGILSDQMDMIIGNIITDENVRETVGFECFDVVVANILTDVLVPLTPVIVRQLKKGGVYITSGIIDNKDDTTPKEEIVIAAVNAAGMEVVEVTHQGEWVSVTAKK